jgi:2-keto-4-pentenoate hydratase/2-oxohepta-3-ene-1,7-dioic acid hydratase in catechol pathway
MRLATVLINGTPTPGLLSSGDTAVFPLEAYDDTIHFIGAGSDAWSIYAEAAKDPARNAAFEHILAPIAHPPKLLCIGLNYRDHAIESNMALPKTPVVFTKFSNSIVGPGSCPRRAASPTTRPNSPSSSARADATSPPQTGSRTSSATPSSTT